jgi:hypothetical protein
MVGRGLTAAAVGSLLAGAALFELISPTPPSKTKLGGVTIQGQPTALSISSETAIDQCLLTLNGKFTAPAKLAPGETLVPWSRFVAGQNVRFDPATERPDALIIDCLKPAQGLASFRFKR